MLAAIDRELAPGGLIVLGELHGTHEAPAFVATAAELAASRGPIVIALELPDDLQPEIDAFVATGDPMALATPNAFWSYRDGRGGEALIALLARLGVLGARVVCFDGAFETVEARDAGMARAILHAVDDRATSIVSCGNLHARTDTSRWMGWHLRERHPALVSLDIRYDGGTAWTLQADGGGIHQLGATRGDPRRGVERFAERDPRGYHGVYHLGPVTASLPVAW